MKRVIRFLHSYGHIILGTSCVVLIISALVATAFMGYYLSQLLISIALVYILGMRICEWWRALVKWAYRDEDKEEL